ncbi:DUF4268 domain-containing protein [Polluticaenibacter yanchengensis]|uniref:DUF4268 domain-containing protein n=1 Tax=Polluticaenibacter yanchengensis TaxID=3014562 RepID=A0ABT4UJD5_9BACT|nr:DUF4268 domain-containing protein [Chitinophagaceae bacterium LY-5]
MYTKEEASVIRQAFWTAYGKYMQPIPSAVGEKVNWVNYKTGVKNVFFKLRAERKSAFIAIVISTKDPERKEALYHQFELMKPIFDEVMEGEEWEWLPEAIDESDTDIATIVFELEDVSVFRKSDWPDIISFLKERMIKLDRFWSETKDFFETI